jgi:hypothetical protein
MPIEIRRLILQDGVQEEDFEKFMIEEVFPAVQTVIAERSGMHIADHTLLKTEARSYWWAVDLGGNPHASEVPIGEVQTVDEGWIETFPTAIGSLKGQLDRYVVSTFSTPYRVLARVTEHLTTPTGAYLEGEQGLWFGYR